MSVTIRLARMGRKNAPSFKIVVANTRDKRNGRFLDILGFYNPSHEPVQLEFDKNKYKEWVGKGALVSDAVKKLHEGTYEYIPYKPHEEEEKKTDDTDAEEIATTEETSEPAVEETGETQEETTETTEE